MQRNHPLELPCGCVRPPLMFESNLTRTKPLPTLLNAFVSNVSSGLSKIWFFYECVSMVSFFVVKSLHLGKLLIPKADICFSVICFTKEQQKILIRMGKNQKTNLLQKSTSLINSLELWPKLGGYLGCKL